MADVAAAWEPEAASLLGRYDPVKDSLTEQDRCAVLAEYHRLIYKVMRHRQRGDVTILLSQLEEGKAKLPLDAFR